MTAYYNEIDKYAADWLRNLIAAGHIAPGIVDTRSIEDVHPSDLKGFTQCHFFAGIGVWSYALRRAGWADDRPVWTGSCPCQPFSAAGQGAGFADERHLWPHFHWLIQECQPAAVFGEQVASKDADPWIDLVQTDLEGLGYAFGAVAFPSASVGAPHIRDRTYWVANAASSGRREEHAHAGGIAVGNRAQGIAAGSVRGGSAGRVGNPDGERAGRNSRGVCGQVASINGQHGADDAHASGAVRFMGDTERTGLALGQRVGGILGGTLGADARQAAERAGVHAGGLADASCWLDKPSSPWADQRAVAGSDGALQTQLEPAGPTNGFWRDADWIFCRDGKWRPVEPGTQPLAHGAPARVGRLRAYGNAINALAAQIFIESAMTEAA